MSARRFCFLLHLRYRIINLICPLTWSFSFCLLMYIHRLSRRDESAFSLSPFLLWPRFLMALVAGELSPHQHDQSCRSRRNKTNYIFVCSHHQKLMPLQIHPLSLDEVKFIQAVRQREIPMPGRVPSFPPEFSGLSAAGTRATFRQFKFN